MNARQLSRLTGLFEEYYPMVWRLLVRLGVPSAAVDQAAIEVFRALAVELDGIEIARERAHLFGLVLRIVSQYEGRPATLPGRARQEPRCSARSALEQVLTALPREQRLVFVLFELEGLELELIAELARRPLSAVVADLHAARGVFQSTVQRLRALSA